LSIDKGIKKFSTPARVQHPTDIALGLLFKTKIMVGFQTLVSPHFADFGCIFGSENWHRIALVHGGHTQHGITSIDLAGCRRGLSQATIAARNRHSLSAHGWQGSRQSYWFNTLTSFCWSYAMTIQQILPGGSIGSSLSRSLGVAKTAFAFAPASCGQPGSF